MPTEWLDNYVRTLKLPGIDRGDWIQTFKGIKFHPYAPLPEEIDIRDIAHALSMICRFGGHSERFYSVAEHSINVSMLASECPLRALLHDASEAYLGDIPRPIKSMMPEYVVAEKRLQTVIYETFEQPAAVDQCKDYLHKWDDTMLSTEMQRMMADPPEPWATLPPAVSCKLHHWSPAKAEYFFLERYERLRIAHNNLTYARYHIKETPKG